MKNLLLCFGLLLIGQWVHAAPASEVTPERRAILVTGASSGIGKSIALTLAENGFYVYAGARKPEDIAALTAIENVEGIRLDVTRGADIEQAVAQIRAAGRGLYGLVNNAGVFLFGPLIEVSERDMQFIFDVNVMGPYRVTRAFAPLIIESQGRITTTGSIASTYSGALFGPYGMTKAAIDNFTEALAFEMQKFGVAVSVVSPGNFRSNIMRSMAERKQQLKSGALASLWEEEQSRFAGFTQADRSHHADPQPVADAALEFMSTDTPKLRYLVTPNQQEAQMAIRNTLTRVVQLNRDHPYSLDQAALIRLLDQLQTTAEQK